MSNKFLMALCGASIALTGCGGSSSSSDGGDAGDKGDGIPPVVKTGVFIDSKVANLSYKTETQTGVTNAQGEFNYLAGERVTFSIGELEFPVVTAAGVITPMTLAGDASIYNQKATNIAILLQSLDDNGNAADGITIPAEAATSVFNALDLSMPTEQFLNNAAVINMVANSGSITTSLVSAADAQNHLQDSIDSLTPYVGSWSNKEGEFESHLVLFANNTFLYAENDDEAPNGLELGSYSYDTATGDITLTITFDNNGPGDDSGVGDIGTPVTVDSVLSNGNTTLKIVNGEIEFTADEFAADSIEGAWSITHLNESQHLILFADNTFIYAENDLTEPNGLELGTYVYNEAGNTIAYTITYDDNGPGQDSGIGDMGAAVTTDIALSNAANTLTITGDAPMEFSRSL